MLRVKQLLTEVLLDVTNSEIADVARLIYVSARAKQARGSNTRARYLLHCYCSVEVLCCTLWHIIECSYELTVVALVVAVVTIMMQQRLIK